MIRRLHLHCNIRYYNIRYYNIRYYNIRYYNMRYRQTPGPKNKLDTGYKKDKQEPDKDEAD